MGAIVNGAAAHGGIVKPYGSTFLIFSDYMRGSRAPVGADGAAGGVGVDARLGRPRRGRADPPADRALRGAARDPPPVGDPPGRRERDGGGVAGGARARGRAGRPAPLAPEHPGARPRRGRGRAGAASAAATCCGTPPSQGRRTSQRGWRPEIILISTGAEVRADARGGARRSPEQGTRVRVVSMPCMELFEAQPQEYRDEVLPPRGERPAGGRAGREHELVEVGRAATATCSASTASAPPRRVRRCSRSSASLPRTSLARARARARIRDRLTGDDHALRRTPAAAASLRARAERVDRLPLARIDPRAVTCRS